MKKTYFAVVCALLTVCLSSAELAVNFKADLAKTAPMADRVKNWVRNGSSKVPHIGTGEVTEENGVACFKNRNNQNQYRILLPQTLQRQSRTNA